MCSWETPLAAEWRLGRRCTGLRGGGDREQWDHWDKMYGDCRAQTGPTGYGGGWEGLEVGEQAWLWQGCPYCAGETKKTGTNKEAPGEDSTGEVD